MHNLEKCGDTTYVDWTKALPNSLSNGITAELRWTFIEMRERRNFFRTQYDKVARVCRKMFVGNEDLDLGIFYELNDGTRGLIDPIQFSGRGGDKDQQTKQGCLTKPPYIWHQGDDRGANEISCERIFINPKCLPNVKRIYIYAFIWRGTPHWYTTDAIVEIKIAGQVLVRLNLDQTESKERFCVAVEIVPQGNMLQVKKLSTFHEKHSACDKAYGWDFKWTSGTK